METFESKSYVKHEFHSTSDAAFFHMNKFASKKTMTISNEEKNQAKNGNLYSTDVADEMHQRASG